jgi:hypothetical protein
MVLCNSFLQAKEHTLPLFGRFLASDGMNLNSFLQIKQILMTALTRCMNPFLLRSMNISPSATAGIFFLPLFTLHPWHAGTRFSGLLSCLSSLRWSATRAGLPPQKISLLHQWHRWVPGPILFSSTMRCTGRPTLLRPLVSNAMVVLVHLYGFFMRSKSTINRM